VEAAGRDHGGRPHERARHRLDAPSDQPQLHARAGGALRSRAPGSRHGPAGDRARRPGLPSRPRGRTRHPPRRHPPGGRRGAGRVSYRVQEGIGSEKAPAPQATLMSLVVKGILTRKLPWALVLIGVFTALLMEVIGVPALAFAVGMYLPLESTTPIFIGGLV